MYRQHASAAKGERLAAQHAIAWRDADLTFMANMLFQGNNKLFRQRQRAQRRTVRLCFHFRRMNTALKIPQLLFAKQI